MTNFASDFCGEWRAGEMPKTFNGRNVLLVSHDQRTSAYRIDIDQVEDFHRWVADLWASDNDPRFGMDFKGGVSEYLDHIGVGVRKY